MAKKDGMEIVQPVTGAMDKLGSSGTQISSGYLREEHISTIQGSAWADKVDEMRRSSEIIGGIYTAIRTAIQGGTYTFDPETPGDEESEAMAKELEWAFFDAPYKKWSETVDEFLTIILYGHYLAAPVTAWAEYEGKAKWIFDDFSWYSPRTIERWGTDERERLVSFYQSTKYSDKPFNGWISTKGILYLAIEKEGSNFAGISPFRRALGNYIRVKLMQKIKLVGIERSALGFPDMTYPADWKEGTDEYEALKTFLKNITSSNMQYSLRPEGTTLDMKQIPFDADKLQTVIQAENTDMSYVVLADFLMLGRDGGGNRMLGDSKRKNFLQSMSYLIWMLIDEINKKYIPMYYENNYGKGKIKEGKGAKLNVVGVEQKSLTEWASVIKMFTDAKVITPDLTLEKMIRNAIDAPPPEEDRLNDPYKAPVPPAMPGLPPGTPPAAPEDPMDEGKKPGEGNIPPATAVNKKEAPVPPKDNKPVAKMGDYPFYENRLRTAAENKCDFTEIGKSIKYGIEDFNYQQKKTLEKVVEDYIYELRKRTLKDGGNIFNVINDLDVPGRALLEKSMTDLIKQSVVAGQTQVNMELARATGSQFAVTDPKLPAGVYAWIKNQSKRITDDRLADIGKKIGGVASTKASFFPVNKKLSPDNLDEILGAAQGVADEWLANASNLTGSSIVPLAINQGRKQAAEANNDVIGFQYSAIIDDVTTEVCRQLDGKTRAIDDLESAKLDPPNHFNCRSILVPITAVEGTPEGGFTGFEISGDAARESQLFKAA